MIRLVKYDQNHYRRFVEDSIQCHRCGREFDNRFAELKSHLAGEWQEIKKKEVIKAEHRAKVLKQLENRRRRKAEEIDGNVASSSNAAIVVEDTDS